MKMIRAYTMGGNDMEWRRQIEELYQKSGNKISFVHPPIYKLGLVDKEFTEWNKQQILKSDIIILNVEKIDETNIYEIGIIDAINTFGNKKIFVIGVGDTIADLKPHIKSVIFHHELDYEDAIDYIKNFLSID